MSVLERLTELYGGRRGLRRSGKQQEPTARLAGSAQAKRVRSRVSPAASRSRRALLVALAVGAMSVFGIGSLRRLADAEGLARVELAVSSAREGIRQSTEDLLTAARILGERPALQRLLRGPVPETAAVPRAVLRKRGARRAARSCAATRCSATTSDGRGLGPRARRRRGAGRAIPRDGRACESVALSGAQAAVTEHPGVTVIVLRGLDERARGAPHGAHGRRRSASSTTRRSSPAKGRSRS